MPVGKVLNIFINDWCGRATHLGGAISGQPVVLDAERKQIEHVIGSKPVSSITSQLCISSCLEFLLFIPSVCPESYKLE